MKKSLLAVAVLGAMSGAAFAQVAPNNITLYGIVDAGLQNQRVTGTNVDSASVSGLNSGIQSGNRWGLRGSEDLGGGLRANFNLESGFFIRFSPKRFQGLKTRPIGSGELPQEVV